MVPRREFRRFMNLARTGAGPVQYPENGSVQGQSSARTESAPRSEGGLGSLGDIGAGPVQVMPLGPLLPGRAKKTPDLEKLTFGAGFESVDFRSEIEPKWPGNCNPSGEKS